LLQPLEGPVDRLALLYLDAALVTFCHTNRGIDKFSPFTGGAETRKARRGRQAEIL
jgi:hypothetical protein